jgi:hypothetical protein
MIPAANTLAVRLDLAWLNGSRWLFMLPCLLLWLCPTRCRATWSFCGPSRLLGANLIGATLGGFSECLGMAVGSRAPSLLVIGG